MSFNTRYIYEVVDKFTPKVKQMSESVKSFSKTAISSTSKLPQQFNKLGQSIEKTAQKVGSLGKKLSIAITAPIALLTRSFVKAASDAQETEGKFATVFASVGEKAEKAAKDLAKNFGLSVVKAKELVGDTGDLLTGFGFSGESALKISDQVNQLAVDLASFTNFSGGAEGASKALTKALLGERESVKSLGISILEEDVKKKVALLRSQGMTFETTRQAKAVATLQIAMEQSKNAIGDYARTSQNYANRVRVLGARFQDLKILLGKAILPMALKLVNYTIKLINKFNELSPTTRKLILIVGGLAAILPPVLIGISLMIPAIKALSVVFLSSTPIIKALGVALKFLALNPIGLVITAIASITLAFTAYKDEMKATFDYLNKKLIPLFERLGNKLLNIKNKILDFGSSIKSTFNSLTFGIFEDDKTANINKNINQTFSQNINSQQKVNIGGQLGININSSQPVSTNFTPAPNNSIEAIINRAPNSTYAY